MPEPKERFIVRYWGVRASIPTPGPETVRYGGNTTCIEIRCDDEIIIIDTGTGARELGNRLMAEETLPLAISVIYSHLHMDHIQGFPFFAPIYVPSTEMRIISPQPSNATSRDFLAWHMAFPWFPVDLKHLESSIQFEDIVPGSTVKFGDVVVDTCPINHPGGAQAIRVTHRGKAFVHASDLEHEGDALDAQLIALARGAQYLSYDSTYIEGDEYDKHKGWGHSTWRHGVRTADAADVETFIAFHHDPSHDDEFMDRVAREMQAEAPGSLVAREGMTLDLLAGTVEVEEHRSWAPKSALP